MGLHGFLGQLFMNIRLVPSAMEIHYMELTGHVLKCFPATNSERCDIPDRKSRGGPLMSLGCLCPLALQAFHCLNEILDLCHSFCSLVSQTLGPLDERGTTQLSILAKVQPLLF